MPAKMLARGIIGTAVTALALALVPAAGAQADPSHCTVTGYAPARVVMGASPVQATFSVTTTGCTRDIWVVSLSRFPLLDLIDIEPTGNFSPVGLTNAAAGPAPATVVATGVEDGPNDGLAWLDTEFSLLRRSTFSTTFNASPEPVAQGGAISIKGQLARASWNGSAKANYVTYAGRTVRVQFKATGTSTYVTVKTVTTSSTGQISTTVPAVRTGTWRLHYGGNSTTAGTDSSGDNVIVN